MVYNYFFLKKIESLKNFVEKNWKIVLGIFWKDHFSRWVVYISLSKTWLNSPKSKDII